MIIDCHTHIAEAGTEAQRHVWIGDSEAIESAIVLAEPHPEKDCGKVNRELAQYMKRHEKDLGFGIVNPVKEKTDIRDLRAIRDDLRLPGIVMYCPFLRCHPTHSKAMLVYEGAQDLGMPVFFHSCGPMDTKTVMDYAQPYLVDEVAREFPDLKIVIACMGEPFVSQTLMLIGKHRNVYADLTISPKRAWSTYNIVVSAHEYDVMDKLLFGSGYPAGDPGECIETLLGFNKLLGDTKLPNVPRGSIRDVVLRDTFGVLGLRKD
jgi:predicted TIM-barrel fold metal-dependent hydrolase